MNEKVPVKMSVNLSNEAVNALRRLAKKRGTTMTEVLRQAIGTEKYIDDALDAGSKILIEDRKGKIREVVFR